MDSRVTSGDPGLDEILGGGFPENSLNLIVGRPGTGKTILASGLLFANITAERKGLYVGTVSEPLAKTVRYMQAFDFFREDIVQEQLIFEDLSTIIRRGDFTAAMKRLTSLVRETGPSYLVIDSLKALHPFATSPEDFRRSLYELAAVLASMPLTAFFVGEYADADIDSYPEFAVADGVIQLSLKRVGVKDVRYLRVMKMRGVNFQGGEHAYRISCAGATVYPRLVPQPQSFDREVVEGRTRTGIEVLDSMVEEGFWRGSSTVVFGPPGSGKTLLGLHFMFKGIEAGERALLVSMQENPVQLARVASGFGWDLPAAQASGMLELIYLSPVDLYIDQVVIELVRKAEESGVRRLVIDSLNDLQASAGDVDRFHDYMYALIQLLSSKGISTYMTSEVSDLFATSYLSQFGVSHMSDNIVLLQYLREESEVKRAIAVLKTRGSKHDPRIREFTIDAEGFRIGEPFSPSANFRA